MSIAAGVILSVALQQVDDATDTQGTDESDHDVLQSIDCAVEKFHEILLSCRVLRLPEKGHKKTAVRFG